MSYGCLFLRQVTLSGLGEALSMEFKEGTTNGTE